MSQSKKALIVSYLFSPNNEIGAVRPTKIAKYLSLRGFNVSVICADGNFIEDTNITADTQLLKEIYRISHSSLYYRIMECRNKILKYSRRSANNNTDRPYGIMQKSGFKKWLSVMIRQSFDLITALDFYYCSRRTINSMNLQDYDYLFSTFGPLGSHLVAGYIRNRNKDIKWIADFRDPMNITTVHIYKKTFEQYGYDRIYKIIQRKICRNCDYIIAVSQGFLKKITEGKHQYKSSVITNGYDPEEYNHIIRLSKKPDTNILTFIYAGALYEGKRDLSCIFRALKDLQEEGKINIKRVQFLYAGKEGHYLKFQARKYDCEDIVQLCGFIPRTKSLELQSKSHILVVATWNEPGYQGVLPGKFLEYMQFKKPILAVVNGTVKDSEIASIIDECQLGFCYEYIQHDKHYEFLKQYIYRQYLSIQELGNVVFNPVSKRLKQYSYENITNEIINIFNKQKEIEEIRSNNEGQTY